MSNYLWAVNSKGRVFRLSHLDKEWVPVPYSGIDIKRLSALPDSIWAIGGDHQIYVFVPTRDVPIRVREVAFENQRWNPVEGFTSRLLPTDRPSWSSDDGLTARYKEDICLPTKNWSWEGDWYLESSLEGQSLAAEGWTYAIDFPAHYGPEKRWNSMVRRRKWIRYRKYTEMNIWAPVPGFYDDPVREPFIDVAIGGLEVPGAEQETVCVWAVTVLGRVMFRSGVNDTAPEGFGWLHIPTPHGYEVYQVSVGPTGLMWAVCWDGTALVRTKVNRESFSGKDWEVVSPPAEDCRISQISVGLNVVWATTTDGKLWFRKGIHALTSGSNDQSAIGTGWVEMVGKMTLLSVGPNDQVWGLGQEDSSIFFRSGITNTELSGKTWKAIILPQEGLPLSRTGSHSSMHWTSNEGSQDSPLAVSLQSSSEHSSPHLLPKIKEEQTEVSLTKLLPATRISKTETQTQKGDMLVIRRKIKRSGSVSSSTSSEASDTILDFVNEVSGLEEALADIKGPLEKAECQAVGETIEEESILEYSMEAPSFMGDSVQIHWDQDLVDFEAMHYIEPSWVWISAGSCEVDLAVATPKWLSAGNTLEISQNSPWRHYILSQFQKRRQKEVYCFTQYPDAVEKSVWVKTGKCLTLMDNKTWESTQLHLKRQDKDQGKEDTSSVLECKTVKKKLLVNLSEITCIMNLSSTSKFIIGLYIGRKNLTQLEFAANLEMEDWLCSLSCYCWDQKSTAMGSGQPAWALTRNGDVYLLHSQKNLQTAPPQRLFWRLLGGGHLRKVESSSSQVVWGLGYNSMAWIYTGGHGGGPFKGIVGRNYKVHAMSDTKSIYIYENQRWNPVTGFTARGLPTDRHMWSDRSGRQHCTKENTKLSSIHWQWVTDWEIDFKVPGGTDKEGWQYASDFPRSYHAYKSFTDYVRRRRWIRRCKLSTTGPWVLSGSTRLLDVSLQVDAPLVNGPVSVWAVAVNGEAIYRKGVTPSEPQGESWEPVPTDEPLVAISVGTSRRVWAVSRSGTAYFRNGISTACPTGQAWSYIEPPNTGCMLQQISVGANAVFAVDEQRRLWQRQEIVDVYPEGTSWKHISDNVLHVSVGHKDQVWAVVDLPDGSGVICRRPGTSTDEPIGTSWEPISQGGWQYVSCRGINNQL